MQKTNTSAEITITQQWYEDSYGKSGAKAQRYYPNEELMRFFGRRLFALPNEQRKNLKILEVGCGSCGNLWMMTKEGFDAYGLDLSANAISLGQQMLNHWHVTANLEVGSMTAMPYPENTFDVICDVFSSYCLPTHEFDLYLTELVRVLKPKGKFFIYTPSSNSDAYKNPGNAKFIDQKTLNGIHREDSPYYGNLYPFRFENITDLKIILKKYGFNIDYCENITKSYNENKEIMEFICLEGHL